MPTANKSSSLFKLGHMFLALGLVSVVAPSLACDPIKPTAEGANGETEADDEEGSGEDGNAGGDDGEFDGEGLNPDKLDRKADCEVGEDDCGYPSKGPGYGTKKGKRIENFVAKNCKGDEVEFAEFFQPNADGEYTTKAVIFTLGAGWCTPCKEETKELVKEYKEFREMGAQVVQLLYQNASSAPPTKAFCEKWEDDYGTQFPVWMDQKQEIFPNWVDNATAPPPATVVVDANANIRFAIVGQAPTDLLGTVKDIVEDPYGD